MLPEQFLSSACQFEQAHTLLHVTLVGGLMPLNRPQASILLSTALGGKRVKHVTVDPAVELVSIKCVDSLLKALVFSLKTANGFRMLFLLVDMAVG
ncbi:hypothetical protein [uncultured Bradyrhizobium sp.]|uniref:hypothetical protein n=1 Tax=uncultured Bradyrhizobium sp. TaxID=199684 RepID=UPI0035CC7338